MENFTKQKNLLDLKYQKLLNYLNIIVISTISFFISFTLAYFDKLKVNDIFSLIILVIIFLLLVLTCFESELNKIKKAILEL